MKVIYTGPGPKTYHPVLGELVTGEPFTAKDKGLSDKEVEKYLKSGLLKKAEKEEPKTLKAKESLTPVPSHGATGQAENTENKRQKIKT